MAVLPDYAEGAEETGMNRSGSRARLVGGFGGAGGTLIVSPILQMLLGSEWPLGLLFVFESVGVILIVAAIVLHLTAKKQE
jgi:hypothetical protein